MSNVKTFCEPCINWNWYTTLQFNEDGTVTVLEHYRLHRYDHAKHPEYEKGISCRLNESPDNERGSRTVIGATIRDGMNWKDYKVANPGFVFGYPQSELTKQPRNW